MTRVDPEKNMAKWYGIDVQPTLFGEFTFERRRCRIGGAGQSKTFWFRDEGAAEMLASQVSIAKARREYIALVLPRPPLTSVKMGG